MSFEGIDPRLAAGAFFLALLLAGLVALLRPLAGRVPVAFGALWEKALARSRGGVPLRALLLAILFAGGIAALAAALAGPVLGSRPPRRVAVLIDVSASMGARGLDGRPRLDEAKRLAARVVGAARTGDALAIYAVSSSVRLVEPWELAGLEVDDTGDDLPTGAAMASTFLEAGAGERHLLVLSDHPERAGAGEPILVGDAASNLAVTRFEISEGNPAEGGLELEAEVENRSSAVARAQLVLHTDRFRLGGAFLALGPGASLSKSFHLAAVPPGTDKVWASLDGIRFSDATPDALARDNQLAAWVPSRGGRPIEVALVTRGDRFLEGALSAMGALHLRILAPGAPIDPATEVVVVDGPFAARAPRARGFLRFGVRESAPVVAPSLLDWNGAHPVTRPVALDDLTLSEAFPLGVRDREVVLAASKEGPLAVAKEGPPREVRVGFDPARSDFPLRLGFPVFMGSAVRWLAGEASGGDPPLEGVAGRALGLPGLAPGALPIPVALDPFLSLEPRCLLEGAAFRTDRAGLYRIDKERLSVRIDPSQSDLRPGTGSRALPSWAGSGPEERRLPLASLLFALAALALSLRAFLA